MAITTINEYLDQFCDEVTPKEFYRAVFPEGSLERRGVYHDGEYTAIALTKDVRTGAVNGRRTVTDDLDVVVQLCKTDDFCVMAPVSYAGKSRSNKNARYLYALAVDVDHLNLNSGRGTPTGLRVLWDGFESGWLPTPTLVVSSGNGIHLYYVFKQPIALFKDALQQLGTYKHSLTDLLWRYGETVTPDHVEYESVCQAFRMPGTITKNGDRARAFWVGMGEKVTMEYMNSFVDEKYRTTVDFKFQDHLSIARAKELYPEWYQRRVVEKQPKGYWTCKKDLYEWWKRRMNEVHEGHRYWSVVVLAVYAKKCGVSFEELHDDAYSMIGLLDAKGTGKENPFTEADVDAALKAYSDDYMTYPIHAIVARTDIPIERNRRNYRKQSVHLQGARAIQAINDPTGEWRKKGGRKSAENIVKQWRKEHKKGKKVDCIRDTGLSKPTVYKWWNV